MAGENGQPGEQRKDSPKDRNLPKHPAAPPAKSNPRAPAVASRDRRRSTSPPAFRKRLPSPNRPDRNRRPARRNSPPSPQRDDDLYRPAPRRDADRAFSPSTETSRKRRRSPRRSPDTYIPPVGRREFRGPPGSSTYRPGVEARRGRSPSPPRNPRNRRNPSPAFRRRSPSPRSRRRSPPHQLARSPPRRGGRKEADTWAPPSRRPRSSPSPPRRHSPPRRRRTPSSSPRRQDPNRKLRSRSPSRRRQPSEDRKSDMSRWHHGRGGPRGGYGQYGHGSPHHPPPPAVGHHHSPYGAGRGWPAPSPYHGSHHGSPYPPPPRQPSYPPVPPPPPPGYYPPDPSQYYGGSPPYPPHTYPHVDRRVSAGQSPPAGRGAPASRRGTFQNLTWTAGSGSRGGAQQTPRGPKREEKEAEPLVKREEAAQEEDDDPFRPAKDLRAEDESREHSHSGRTPTKAELEEDRKFKFALKSKPIVARQSSSAFEKPVKKEKRLVKRIVPKPTLPADFAASDSVYYRKPGNESVVGSGTYGKVFRAIHVYTGEKVALKKIRMEGERDGFPVTAIREVKLLQSLNNDNVVRLQEVMVEKNDCYMVFEYLSHDLTGLLNHPFFILQDAHKKHLARQLFEGLDYLHRRGVLHRDIKAANILVSNTGQLKLADFGLARFFAKRRQLDYTNRVITIWYRSPELLLGETQYGPAVDIWSAACVLVEIFTKHAIFPGDGGEINQLDKIYNVLGTPTRTDWPNITEMAWFELLRPQERRQSTFAEKYKERVTPAAFDLLTQMFQFDPLKRPLAEEVLKHAYFVEEEPSPKRAMELQELEGDWHEFESKALRKEKERREREERKAREHEAREAEKRKKYGEAVPGSEEREAKRQRVDIAEPTSSTRESVNGTNKAS